MIGVLSRIRVLALILLSMVFILGPVFAKPCLAAFSVVERSEDDLLILELTVNDALRSRALLGYLPETADLREALLPLSGLSRLLSFAIDVDTVGGVAQGWFLRENNVFQLDLARQVVLVKGQEVPLPPGVAEAHYNDIFVQAQYLEDWFDLDIDININLLRMSVKSSEALPFEEEAERLRKADELAKAGRGLRPDYSQARFLPYKRLSYPSVVLQSAVNGQSSDFGSALQGSYSVQTSGDVLGFGSRFVLSGNLDRDNGHSIQNTQLTFQRRDPENNLLGPLRAGAVSFGDIDFPDVPLIVSRKRGRGFSVSSDNRLGSLRSFGPEETVIDGDGPIGWDAELYRNGFFVAFQEVGGDGRYSFEDVELIDGFNLFKIVLYGPEGQKRTETQRVVRGAQLLAEDQMSYEFALGQPDADFLPLADNAQSNSNFGASGRFFYGLRKYLTLGGSVFRGTDVNSAVEDEQTAATFSAVTSFLGFRTQLQLTRGSEGRSARDIETTTQFGGVNLSVGRTVFDGFDENDRRLRERTSASVNKNFGPFSASIRGEQRKFLDQEDENVLDTTLSTKLLGVSLTNRLERTFSKQESLETFDGDLSAAFNAWNWRVRSNFIYDLQPDVDQHLQRINVSALRTFDTDDRLRLNLGHDFTSDRSTAEARYTRVFDDFSLDWNLGGASDNNYFTGVTLRTALQPDYAGQYRLVNAKEGALPGLGIRAYVDGDGNGQYDDGETLLENIRFRSNRGLFDEKTNADGLVFVTGLSEGVTRFSIDESGLPSIYLQPATDHIDVFPRVGTTAVIDVAFSQLGEIDGFVYAFEKDEDGENKAVPGVEVVLIDSATQEEVQYTHSEYDGYYIFSGIPVGSYQVRAKPLWQEAEDSLPSRDVVLSNEEFIQIDMNLVMPPLGEGGVGQDEGDDIARDDSAALGQVAPAAGVAAKQVMQKAEKAEAAQVASSFFIHVGSLSSRAGAEQELKRLKATHPKVLGPVSMSIRDVAVRSKTYYRLLGAVPSRASAKELCNALERRKIASGCNIILDGG